jgi:hypothetical protein
MKNIKKLIPATILLGCSLLLLPGCGTVDVEPLGYGFEEVTHSHSGLAEPRPGGTALDYVAPKPKWATAGKRTRIWPSLYVSTRVVTNDIALFVGEIGYRAQPNNDRAIKPRAFAFKVGGPPLDITDEVLLRWAKKTGEDFNHLRSRAEILGPKRLNNHVEFLFAGGRNDVVVTLDWNEILDVIREVKEKGVVRKDSVWNGHTTYIVKEFPLAERK